MLTQKEIAEMREQIKREINDLDHQIFQLETFYIEDTKEAGNLLKGFDNYISLKTSKIQSLVKKQKVENYERIFSLTSFSSKTSQTLQQSFINEPSSKFEIVPANASKRNRPRQGGKTKSGGKNLVPRQQILDQQSQSQSVDGEGADDSIEESIGKSRQANKKKKISKMPTIRKN